MIAAITVVVETLASSDLDIIVNDIPPNITTIKKMVETKMMMNNLKDIFLSSAIIDFVTESNYWQTNLKKGSPFYVYCSFLFSLSLLALYFSTSLKKMYSWHSENSFDNGLFFEVVIVLASWYLVVRYDGLRPTVDFSFVFF